MSFHDRLKRVARKNNGIICGDPEAVLASLQIAKRLFGDALREGPALTVVQALDRAIPMASPKDPVRVRHYALRVLIRNTSISKSPLAILADSIAGQSKVNKLQSRGPQA